MKTCTCLVLALICFNANIYKAMSSNPPACKTENNGITYDFTSISKEDFIHKPDGSNFTYCLHICGNCGTQVLSKVQSCNSMSIPTGSVVKYNSDVCRVLGVWNSDVYPIDIKKTWYPLGVQIKLSNGDMKDCRSQRNTPELTINLLCDKNTVNDRNFGVTWDGNCKYDVNFGTSLACVPDNPQPGPAPGPTPGPTPGPSPSPIPPKALAAVYQGKCGLGKIGQTIASKGSKDPATQKKLQDIMLSHLDNLKSSCDNSCKLTPPDIQKFIQPNAQRRQRLLEMDFGKRHTWISKLVSIMSGMDHHHRQLSNSNLFASPSSIPSMIPSKICNCNVKELTGNQITFLKKETSDSAGEPTKMCRMHLTMTKLDGTSATGTIKNYLMFPYINSCPGETLNDQINLLPSLVCILSASTDVSCRSTIECDGDANWVGPFFAVLAILITFAAGIYGAYIVGKRDIDLCSKLSGGSRTKNDVMGDETNTNNKTNYVKLNEDGMETGQ